MEKAQADASCKSVLTMPIHAKRRMLVGGWNL